MKALNVKYFFLPLLLLFLFMSFTKTVSDCEQKIILVFFALRLAGLDHRKKNFANAKEIKGKWIA